MAGYMEKMTGNVYEGEHKNGAAAAVKNGTLMLMGTTTNKGKLVLPAQADTTTVLVLLGTEDLEGATGYRFAVNKLNDAYYFIENGYEYNDANTYDTHGYTIAVGELLRAHPLQVGDQFVTDQITGTLTVGTGYGVKTDGTIG